MTFGGRFLCLVVADSTTGGFVDISLLLSKGAAEKKEVCQKLNRYLGQQEINSEIGSLDLSDEVLD